MSEQTQHLVEALRLRVRAAARRITFSELLFGTALTVGLAAVLWLLATGAETIFWFGTTTRTVIFWGVLLSVSAAALWFIVIPLLRLSGLLRGPSDYDVAERIGTQYPSVEDRLTNLLQLADGHSSRAPAPLVDGAVRHLGEELKPVTFTEVEDFSRPRRAAQLAIVPLTGLLFLFLAAPSMFLSSSERLIAHGVHFERPAPFSLDVEPQFAELIRGDSLDITVRATGEIPESLTLLLNNLNEEAVDEVELYPDEDGTFTHRIERVRQSLRYRAVARPVETRWYEAHVMERPMLRNLQVHLTYPEYSGLQSESLEANRGNIHALPGTEVRIETQTGGSDVETALLAFDNGTIDSMDVSADSAIGTFTLMEDGSYEIVLISPEGIENRDPIQYSLRKKPDAPPTIELLSPERESSLTTALTVPLEMRIRDDFGFSQLRLEYRLAETRYGQPMEEPEHVSIPLPSRRNLDQNIPFEWLLRETTELDPVPGDVIEYYVRVWDNDTVLGPKASRSAVHRLRLPSLAERYDQLDEVKNETEGRIRSSLESAQSIREQFESVRDQLRRQPEADWEDERQVERLREQQDALEQEVDELIEQVESISETLRQNDMASEETAAMWQELQEVVREIESPELREALQQLQEAMQQQDMQAMQQALENFDFDEEQYRQRLERTLELFNNLRVQQELEEGARRLEDLAEQQERLSEQTGERIEQQDEAGEEGQEDLARAQDQAAEDMQGLEEHLQEVQERMNELRQAPKEELEEFLDRLQQEQMQQQLQENAQQLRQNQLQDAQQGQQNMQQQLQQMQSQLSEMQQQMQGQQMQFNIAGLRQALSDVVTLSQQQEDVRSVVRSSSQDSPILREEAQRQTRLSEGLRTVSDSLQRIAADVPQMGRAVQEYTGRALREMQGATASLSERALREAGAHQRSSMMHLNELALLLAELLDQLQGGQGGGGMSMEQMMQQLQDMAADQEQLNQQIQQMLNETQGERLSVEQEERLQQMAEQQRAIQQQIRELNRQRELRNRTLGDLERIAEEMEQSIEELQGRQIDRELQNRQEQILARLLETTRSLHRQDEDQERRGRSAEQILRDSPPDLTPEEQADILRRALLRSLESGYAPDYEDLIRRYFELLQEHNTNSR